MRSFKAADYKATHFKWEVSGKVATITLNRPERKNPLTFESYGELGRLFRSLEFASDVKAVVLPAKAAISAPAATSTRSSGRSSGCRKKTTWRACSPSRA